MFAKSGNLRVITSLVLLALLVGVSFAGYLPQLGNRFAVASSSVVQENSGYPGVSCGSGCTSLQIPFNSNVTAGDVVVVLFRNTGDSSAAVTDTLGSIYTLQSIYSPGTYQIFTATLGASATDTVTITATGSPSASIAIFGEIIEVAGVTTAQIQNATGDGTCTSFPCSVSTGPSLFFNPGAFLVSFTHANPANYVAGSGFTANDIFPDGGYDYVQYAASGVSSPTNFTATLTDNESDSVPWQMVAVALEPISTTTTVPTTTTYTSATPTTTETNATTSTSTVTSTISSTITSSSSSTISSSSSTVHLHPTTTYVSCIPSKARPGQTVKCTGTVKSTTIPSGQITFTYYEGTIAARKIAACNRVPNSFDSCSAAVTFTFPFSGSATVTAVYSGDLTHQGSHGATFVRICE